MTTQIKITQLTNIGSANTTVTSLLPIVNMSGVPTTQKTTLGNLANVILSQSGGNYAPANLANIAYSVTNAAQPNITSTGTLSSLSVSGNANIGSLQFIGANISTPVLNGNIYLNGNGPNGHVQITANNFNWTFDPNGNMTLSDGTTMGLIDANNALGFDVSSNMQFQIMTDNGTDSYSWYFNKNGSMIFPAAGNNEATIQSYTGTPGQGSFVKLVTSASSNFILGTAGNNHVVINTNKNGANARWIFDDVGNLTLPGNTFAINYANGQQVPLGGGGANTGNIGFTGNAIYNLGGILVENADLTHGATAALSLPNNANTSNPIQITNTYGNVQVTTGITAGSLKNWTFDNNGGLTFPGGTVAQNDIEGTGNFGFEMPANVGFDILADLGNSEWSFGANGTLTLAGDINATPSGFPFSDTITDITTGNSTVVVTVSTNVFPDPVTGQVTISGVIGTSEANDVWYYQAVNGDQFQLFSDAACTIPVDGTSWTAYISGGNAYASQFSSLAISTNGLQVVAGGESWAFDNTGQINIPTQSNSFNKGRIQSANGYPTLLGYGSGEHGGPELDWMDSDDPATAFMNANVLRNTMYINDNGLYVGMNENHVANVAVASWRFSPDGNTYFPTLSIPRGDNPSGTITGQTLLFGDNTQEAIISTPDGTTGNEYSQRLVINPGAGSNFGEGGDIYLWAGRGGDGSGSGGDIKIRGGQGGANTSGGNGGDGGYIRIEAGDTASTGGYPGYVTVVGGNSATIQGGYVEILGGRGATMGGNANLKGGYGTATGGNVNIWGGASGNGQVNEGYVNIQTGGNTWSFGPSANLTFPDSTIQRTAYTGVAEPGFTLQAGNFTAVAGGRYGVDTYNADGPVTATLPASPNNGDAVFFADAGGYAQNGALTIDAGTNSIMDNGTTMTVTTSNQSVGLFWNGRTWRTYNAG